MSTLLPTIPYGTLKGIIHNLDWALRGIGERSPDSVRLEKAKREAIVTLENIAGMPALVKLCKWKATVPTFQEIEQLDARLNTPLGKAEREYQYPAKTIGQLTLSELAGVVDGLNASECVTSPAFRETMKRNDDYLHESEQHPERYHAPQELHRHFCETVGNLKQEILKAGRAAVGADTSADTSTKKIAGIPRNYDAVLLARRIVDPANKGRSQIAIALDFTEGHTKKANNLLRSVRRNKLIPRVSKP